MECTGGEGGGGWRLNFILFGIKKNSNGFLIFENVPFLEHIHSKFAKIGIMT
jgi:hypothetical protein